MTAVEHERRFPMFGTDVRLLVGPPLREGLPSPAAISLQIEGLMHAMHARLTRFDPGSELSLLNADRRETVEASSLLIAAVGAAVRAAELSGGLVDPTVVDELESAGYARSRSGEQPASLRAALAAAPRRRPARPRRSPAWKRFAPSLEEGVVSRPPGTRIDVGGTAKGLAADLAAAELGGYAGFAVDVGGDMRIGGESTAPREVRIEHPLRPGLAHSFRLGAGAVATSGIVTRLWTRDGGYAHHLIDPSSGGPAWTGLVQATAIAPTAVEAEALAKAAFLSGPGEAAAGLLGGGGVLVADDGSVEPIGLAAEPAGLPPEPAGLSAEPAGLPPEPAGLPPEPAGLAPEPMPAEAA